MKRVALDFSHPVGEAWPGYVCPHNGECAACGGSGYTTAGERLQELVSLLMLSGSDAQRGQCHPYFYETPLHRTQGKTCGADMLELTTSLAGRAPFFMGHDSFDKWSAAKKIIAAAGMPDSWGTCAECDGHGTPQYIRALQEAWKETEPPAGEGWQLWETVSAGSPITPVFATPEALATWLSNSPSRGSNETDFDGWMRFLNALADPAKEG